MKSKNIIMIVAATAAVLTACTKEPVFEIEADSGLIPLNIDGSISQVSTKATAQGFVNKDAVGLFAVNYTDDNTVPGTLVASGNQADNVKYVFDEGAQKWVPMKAVYYKNVNTHADIYVYYPYQSGISDPSGAGFEVQKDQSTSATAVALSGYEASDWLWGKAEDVAPSESKVRIPLSHRLSAVQVTLVEGTGFGEDEFGSITKSVILTNTTRKATLNFATGEATPLGSPQLDGIVMCPQETGAFRAIVIPQSVAAATQLFAITLDGVSYSFKQAEAVNYQAGKQLNVSITLNKKTPSGEYELVLGSTTIVDWTEDRNTHGGEARQYFVVNVETPGTLGATIEAMGKNPAKIRNLKVTGRVTTEDFYFMRDNMDILEAVNMKEVTIKNAIYWGEVYSASSLTGDNVIPARAFYNKSSLVSFVFPENVEYIGGGAFSGTRLTGALSLPYGLKKIYEYYGGYTDGAFEGTLITSVSYPETLTYIGRYAFWACTSLTGDCILPDSITKIRGYAFSSCNFKGQLHLPVNLEVLEDSPFFMAGEFVCDLKIPDKITTIGSGCFRGTKFHGTLNLNNLTSVGDNAFAGCGFSGELDIPEGTKEISAGSFSYNNFIGLYLPSTLTSIGYDAFMENHALMSDISFPKGVLTIGSKAFFSCDNINSVYFPSTLIKINDYAFSYCYNLSSIVCDADEPPLLGSGVFDSVPKDNFTVGVPAKSVIKYQADSGWNVFRRIASHYDFSLSRRSMRTLNAAQSRTLILRAPAGFDWRVDADNLPDWITVSPMSGTGKTDVTINVSEMARTDDSFEVNEGTFNSPRYVNYKGRSGEVMFVLEETGYTFSINVEQYDSDYTDGQVQVLQTASVGSGINVIFTGDGYDARDIAKGLFAANAAEGFEHMFYIEPYKTYKDYFNVYAVLAQSYDSGIGSINTVVNNKFETAINERIRCKQIDSAFSWAKRVDASLDLTRSLVILLANSPIYDGVCYLYADGSALALCPVSTSAYPYDYRGIIQHEAGGHGFGKLADEYIQCPYWLDPCPLHGSLDTKIQLYQSFGWYKNISLSGDSHQVSWAHLIYHPQYSDYVDIYEGGYMHARGVYRSEATSCMNNNIPYYSAISRQAIVERIKAYAGEEFNLEDFYANDSRAVGTKAGVQEPIDRTFGVDPLWNRGSEHGSVVYMGEHPNVK